MTCVNQSVVSGSVCVGIRPVNTIAVQQFSDLSAIELRGNGGCSGTASRGMGQSGTVTASGGAGGAGGGGLYISANAYNFTNLTIDTSGEDGSLGGRQSVSGQRGSATVRGGSGAGGNAGRIILVEDGSPSTIGRTSSFVVSRRGRNPNADGNANRDEVAVLVTRLNCPPRAIK